MKLLRSLARVVGRVLLGGAVLLFTVAIALLAVGAYLVAVPAAKVSRSHEQLVAVARALQAVTAAIVVIRASRPAGDDELELDEEELSSRA